jgi:hypothetical protein
MKHTMHKVDERGQIKLCRRILIVKIGFRCFDCVLSSIPRFQ